MNPLPLNRENFFDEIELLCPLAGEYFNRWFDEFKKKVNWDFLFNSTSDYQNYKAKNAPVPSFYDLPFEFQNGIIARFEIELFNNRDGKGSEKYIEISNQYRGQVRDLYYDLERKIQMVEKFKHN
jgi:hypothetical protein